MTAAALVCGSCGTELPPNAKFCNECGAAVATATTPAEYKQVTVLFADVVHSMYIASVLGAERLREIMAEVVNIATAVVKRYGGTVDKFTGDGIMAVFGAPVALEDHAVRACLAALEIQDELARLAAQVRDHDGVELALRIGLNSGQVIAGEVGSASLGYTTIGEQVGMAQRMESVAPAGGVMLSASTARLVDGAAALGEPEAVRIKGADEGVPVCRLLGMRQDRTVKRAEANLVGRRWEMNAVEGLLDRAIDGHGAVVGVVGSPGVGKSRLVRELSAMASARGVEVFVTFCESHTSQIPFHAVARLLGAATGVDGLGARAARDQLRYRVSDADPEDLVLFDDLLGIADPDVELPKIDPDARRRRLTALVNAASLARTEPAVFVIEDAHWVDEVSESLLADFFTVIPQTPSLVLATYRPEYEGALARVHGAQTIALSPLSDSETAALVTELIGPDPSVSKLGQKIAERAAGNPFFAEEIVRELAERGVLRGEPGAYMSAVEVGEVSVPVTLQATIAARIDRLDPKAKRTLSAAAVIGSRFSLELLKTLGIEPILEDLVVAELVDQVRFTRGPEYVFHHPLIRAVAYEAQLKSDRADLHRRVASAIEQRSAGSLDENAALIAEHLEAAGDLRAAYDWHMRAGTWLIFRDITAAQTSWRRARQIADRLPDDDRDRLSMRIAPRTLLCGTAYRVRGGLSDPGFEELCDLCTAAGDQRSQAIGLAGQATWRHMNAHCREASRRVDELVRLLESIDDPALTAAIYSAPIAAKEEMAEMAEVLRMAQRVIDLDPSEGNLVFEAPLPFAFAMRGIARFSLGIAGWKDDFHQAVTTVASAVAPTTIATVRWYTHAVPIAHGVLLPDATILGGTADLLSLAEQSGDDFTLDTARTTRGVTLLNQDGPERKTGLDLLAKVGERIRNKQFTPLCLPVINVHIAREMVRVGDIDGAIELTRTAVEHVNSSGGYVWSALASSAWVESLVLRGGDQDLKEAQAEVDRLAAVPTDPGFVLHEVWLPRLHALLARARGDAAAYADFRDRYRDMARTLGFEGHIAWAEAMP